MKVYCKNCKYLFLPLGYYNIKHRIILTFIKGSDYTNKDMSCSHSKNLVKVDDSDSYKEDIYYKPLLSPTKINMYNNCDLYEEGEHWANKIQRKWKDKNDKAK